VMWVAQASGEAAKSGPATQDGGDARHHLRPDTCRSASACQAWGRSYIARSWPGSRLLGRVLAPRVGDSSGRVWRSVLVGIGASLLGPLSVVLLVVRPVRRAFPPHIGWRGGFARRLAGLATTWLVLAVLVFVGGQDETGQLTGRESSVSRLRSCHGREIG
jgi:hypothetical protein